MSISVMTSVWKQSTHKGNALLLLLAIADNAADDGYAWPGTRYLADKIRASRQTVMRLTKDLEESGELYAIHSRRIGNKYIVLTGFDGEEISSALAERFNYEPEKICNILICNKMLHQMSQNVTSDVTPVLHQPSLNHHESSLVENDTAAIPPPPPKKKPPKLAPDTPQSQKAFGKLRANAALKGRRGPQQFKTQECKDKFDAAAETLNGEFDKALNTALEQGITSVTGVTNYISKWASNLKPRHLKLGA